MTPTVTAPNIGTAALWPADEIAEWVRHLRVNRREPPTVKLPRARAGDGRTIRRVLIDRRDLDALIERHREAQ